MKKLLLAVFAMLALTASADVVISDSIEYDGNGAPGFSYPAPKTVIDLTALIDYLLDPYPICEEWLPAMDMNLDGDITLEDVSWLVDYLLDKQQDD